MTRIDFYVTASEMPTARFHVTCRLAEKAYQLGHAVHIHVDSAQTATRLDQFMWTFRDGSFLPHALSDDEVLNHCPELCPIVIGHEHEPRQNTEILINLDHEVPTFFSRINRVMEIVDTDDKTKKFARERFKFYRDRGYDLKNHKV